MLALKDNQGQLHEDVQLLFNDLESSPYRAYAGDYAKTVDKGHGRLYPWGSDWNQPHDASAYGVLDLIDLQEWTDERLRD